MLVIALLVLVITAAAWRFWRTTPSKISSSALGSKLVSEAKHVGADSDMSGTENTGKTSKKASGPTSKPEKQKVTSAEHVDAKPKPKATATLKRRKTGSEVKETVVESTNGADGSFHDDPSCS